MERTELVAEAKAAGKTAKHNLRVIRKQPEKMLPGKVNDAEVYLNTMIRIAELEMKNDRRAGQSQLRTHLKSLVVSILTVSRAEGKGGQGYV
jgi:DNA recombination-dependent growth factor C